ncbi:MAG: SDR family oxidoreductase [Flavobacteriia bacterium]|nr:SDR family oxidoreductase [Flavobacteriia bacterium]
MRILITGSNGLLGQKIVKLCLEKGLDFIATSKGTNRNQDCPAIKYLELDITNPREITSLFENYYPTHVIHTAAITNVDYCEDHSEECFQVNVQATQNLFEASKRFQAHFEFLSTDFVFDGEKGNYEEEDPVNPLSVYAKSKVEGEKLLINDVYTNWSIVRTIIVYGEGNNLSRSNLILWSINALKKGDEIQVVDDQFRAPTWAADLAWACLRIVEKDKKGIFHISGPETYSILEIVFKVADYFNLDKNCIIPIQSNTLNQAAKRPPNTGFNLNKARKELEYNPLTLIESLGFLSK